MILETFKKSPVEVIDYDFDFSAWLLKRGNDMISSFTVTCSDGLYITQSTKISNVIKAFVSGGVDTKSYEVSCVINTAGGRTKEAKIKIIIG
jgi:hypothetical protein